MIACGIYQNIQRGTKQKKNSIYDLQYFLPQDIATFLKWTILIRSNNINVVKMSLIRYRFFFLEFGYRDNPGFV